MSKKIISILLTCLIILPLFITCIYADEAETKTYTLTELAASLEDGQDSIILQPGDMVTWEGENNYQYLIFAYTTDSADGSESYSPGSYVYFADAGLKMNEDIGYTVKELDSKVDYYSKSDIETLSKSGSNVNIDFTSELKGIAFAGWEVKEVHTDGFNRITVCAVWDTSDVLEFTGWVHFTSTLKKYLRIIIKRLVDFLIWDFLANLSSALS